MHDYTTIIGVIELRSDQISYDKVQKRYRIGSIGITLIINRFKESGLALDDLKQMPPDHLYYKGVNAYDGAYYRRWTSVYGESMVNSSTGFSVARSTKNKHTTAVQGYFMPVKMFLTV